MFLLVLLLFILGEFDEKRLSSYRDLWLFFPGWDPVETPNKSLIDFQFFSLLSRRQNWDIKASSGVCLFIHYLCAAPGFGAAPLLHIQQETSQCGPSLFLPRILLHLRSTLRTRRVWQRFSRFKYLTLTLIAIWNAVEWNWTRRKCKIFSCIF